MSWCRKKQIFPILHLLPTSLPSYRSTDCWLVETVLLHRWRSFNCRKHWIWLECFKNLLSLKLNHKETRISKDFRLKYILQILNMRTMLWATRRLSDSKKVCSHLSDVAWAMSLKVWATRWISARSGSLIPVFSQLKRHWIRLLVAKFQIFLMPLSRENLNCRFVAVARATEVCSGP